MFPRSAVGQPRIPADRFSAASPPIADGDFLLPPSQLVHQDIHARLLFSWKLILQAAHGPDYLAIDASQPFTCQWP